MMMMMIITELSGQNISSHYDMKLRSSIQYIIYLEENTTSSASHRHNAQHTIPLINQRMMMVLLVWCGGMDMETTFIEKK